MKRLLILLFVLWLALLVVMPVMAQDAPPAVPSDVMTPEQAAALGFQTVLAIAAAFIGSGFTAAIVGALKYFIPKEWDIATVKNVVGVLLMVAYWIAAHYGFQNAFQSVGEFAVVFIPAALALYGTLKGAPLAHEVASKLSLPLAGYDRTP